MIKKSPAFQFYPADWLSDIDVMLMTAEQEGAYLRLVLLCWMDNDLSLPDDDGQLSVLARINKGGLTKVKAKFKQHPTKPGFLTHNRLQKEAKKQQKWREKSSKGGKKSRRNGTENKQKSKGGLTKVQPNPDSSSSSSSSSSLIKGESLRKDSLVISTPEIQMAVSLYNGTAKKLGLPLCQKLSDARKSKIRARLSECGGLQGWQEAMNKLEESDFLRGENEKGWRADFEFILQQKSFNRLIEGGYNNRKGIKKHGKKYTADDAQRDALRELGYLPNSADEEREGPADF